MIRAPRIAAQQRAQATMRQHLTTAFPNGVLAQGTAAAAVGVAAPIEDAATNQAIPLDGDPDERMARIEELTASLRERNRGELRAAATTDYDSCHNQFKEFVEILRSEGMVQPTQTIYTVFNVELFFQIVITNKQILPKSAKKFLFAIEYHAKRAEQAAEAVAFRTPAVIEALVIQEERSRAARRNQPYSAANDPHSKRRTDVLSVVEIRKVIHVILNQNNWKDMFVTWTTCEQAMLRNASLRVLRFCHLRFNTTHGPPILDPVTGTQEYDRREPMLEIVLEPGLHKTGKDDTMQRSTGMWRHKDYKRCATGAMAITTLLRLWDDGDDWDFYWSEDANNPGAKPEWQSHHIVTSWADTSSASADFVAATRMAGVCWAKSTHLRFLSIEYASKMGLSRGQTATLSKHAISSLDDCYCTELLEHALHKMSTDREKVYDVPRTRISLPSHLTEDQLVRCFCPNYGDWLDQQSDHHHGDNLADREGNESAARNFLLGVVPFFCKVLFQDGIYWVDEYPQHTISRFLIRRLPNWYSEWAAQQRLLCREQLRLTRDRQVQHLNDAATAALSTVGNAMINSEGRIVNSIDRLGGEIGQMLNANFRVLREDFDRRFESMAASMEQRLTVVPQQPAAHQQFVSPVHHQHEAQGPSYHGQEAPTNDWMTRPTNSLLATRSVLPRQAEMRRQHYIDVLRQGGLTSPDGAAAAPFQPTQTPTAVRAVDEPFQLDSTTPLPTPQFASQSRAFPRTFVDLVNEVMNFDLWKYYGITGRRSHWPLAVQKALGRRLYLFKMVRDRAESDRSHNDWDSKLKKAAKHYQNIISRKGWTLAQSYNGFRRQFGEMKARKKRNNEGLAHST